MEDKMAHPDWALKHKIKGTELRNIKGKFYLYRITSKYDKERKVTRKITLEMLGRITEQEGFIPKGQKVNKPTKTLPPVSVKEYGATKFLQSLGHDIFCELAETFPEHWRQLAILAMHRLIYQAPLKNNKFLYHESFLSETLSDIKLDKNFLTLFMQELGKSRDKITAFMSKYVAGEKNIIFDATHIFSHSQQSNMNAVGYNSKRVFEPQINLLYMFSVDNQTPLYYRVFPGNVGGMRALKLSIEESGAKNCTVIGDKGFASEENFSALEKEKLKYIFPLKRDSKLTDYQRLEHRKYGQAFDGHFLFHDRPIFYYQLGVDAKGRQVTIFHDPKLRSEEEACYLRRIASKTRGYDIESFENKQLTFGTIAMISNLSDVNAEEIYVQYKQRMEIETLFDTYKNLLEADSSYMHSDAGFEAWSFINHLSTMLYYRIAVLLKSKDKIGQISPRDLLIKLGRVFKVKINDNWQTSEINLKTIKFFSALDITVT